MVACKMGVDARMGTTLLLSAGGKYLCVCSDKRGTV